MPHVLYCALLCYLLLFIPVNLSKIILRIIRKYNIFSNLQQISQTTKIKYYETVIILFFLCYTIPLIAQHTDPIQEAMANYDYETALSLLPKMKIHPSPAIAERQSIARTRAHHRGTCQLSGNYP